MKIRIKEMVPEDILPWEIAEKLVGCEISLSTMANPDGDDLSKSLSSMMKIFEIKGEIKHEVGVEEEEENTSTHEENRRGTGDRVMHCRIIGESRREGAEKSQGRNRRPDDDPWEKSADDEHGEENAPGHEEFPCPISHGGEHIRIDDGIVDTRNHLEQDETDDNENCGEEIHS
jgi:hypothetical protein